MKKGWNIIYLCLAVGMLIYAAPQLQVGHGLTLPTVFTIVWLGFALMIISSHLYEILRVDYKVKEAMNEEKRMQGRQLSN